MKLAITVLFAALTLVGEAQIASAYTSSGSWICKTAPIWNGRGSAPRYLSGSTRDEAFAKAVEACRYSGYANVCTSYTSCWQE